MKTTENINPNRKKYIILGTGIGLLAIGGFSYWYFVGREKKTENNEDDFLKPISTKDETTLPITKPRNNTSKPPASTPKKSNTEIIANKKFPVKSGSKGAIVKKIQEALIKSYGKNILPKYGADGYYGKELANALNSKGFPSVIDETAFNKITGTTIPVTQNVPNDGLSPEVKEHIDIAKNIWLNATIKKLEPMIEQLNRIKSVDQYKKVNDIFKTIRLRGTRQTIVNAALSTFSDNTSKQFISDALKLIGLKYSDEKWQLSGLFRR